ncbi:MAG: hypothetical protein QOD40_2108 [Alphaproteobacteria bacterium]|jgi:hypothetical protein|nr:hypothetical protein [Alphaproteobacteria bacterium]
MEQTSDSRHGRSAAPSMAAASSRGQLGQFCAAVLDDASWQEKLRQPDSVDEFVALVLESARQFGFSVTAEDVLTVMRERSLGLINLQDSPVSETKLPPEGWLPVRTSWHGNQLYVHWTHFGDRPLREPFFESSVQQRLFKPFNKLFRYFTPIERLGEWLDAHPPLPPSGFIFHMSRCGSTLVSQMLAALGQNVVVSEASPIDAVVQASHLRPDMTQDQHALWLRWMIGAFGQPRRGGEKHFFVKLDCWHALALPLFRRAFPTVPWVFLYRDPVEVLVSQLQMPGAQMIPGVVGPNLLDLPPSADIRQPEEYYACFLGSICEAVLQHHDGGAGLLVNYRQLPSALWKTILPHFAVSCSDLDQAAMTEAAQRDAKAPSFEFAADSEAKQQAATEAARSAADRWLGESYRRLEALRCGP